MSLLKDKVIRTITFVVEVVERFFDDHCPQLAAALAYYAIFSIPPLLILFMTAAGGLVDASQVEAALRGGAARFISPRAADQLVEVTHRANDWAQTGPWWSLVLSILGLLFGATRAFAQLQTALNRAWAIPEKEQQNVIRVFLVKRLISFAAIMAMLLLFFVFLIARAVLDLFGDRLESVLPSAVMPALDWLTGSTLSIVAGTVLLAAIYRYLPDAKIRWKQVLPGALVIALLFEGTKSLIRLYLVNIGADIFGQAASFAVLMIWLFVWANLLFLGAEFTEVWARRLGSPVVGAGEKKHTTPAFTKRLEHHLKRLLEST